MRRYKPYSLFWTCLQTMLIGFVFLLGSHYTLVDPNFRDPIFHFIQSDPSSLTFVVVGLFGMILILFNLDTYYVQFGLLMVLNLIWVSLDTTFVFHMLNTPLAYMASLFSLLVVFATTVVLRNFGDTIQCSQQHHDEQEEQKAIVKFYNQSHDELNTVKREGQQDE